MLEAIEPAEAPVDLTAKKAPNYTDEKRFTAEKLTGGVNALETALKDAAPGGIVFQKVDDPGDFAIGSTVTAGPYKVTLAHIEVRAPATATADEITAAAGELAAKILEGQDTKKPLVLCTADIEQPRSIRTAIADEGGPNEARRGDKANKGELYARIGTFYDRALEEEYTRFDALCGFAAVKE